jgi:hypothetical protein
MFKRKINKIEVPETIEIINGTKFKNIETIVKALAYKVFGFNKLKVRIYYLPKTFRSNDMVFWGVSQKAVDGPQSYQIFLNKELGRYSLRKTLSHEFVHIEQYESGRLQITGSEYLWDGKPGDMHKVKYNDRPFEIDAIRRQRLVLKELKKVLYK